MTASPAIGNTANQGFLENSNFGLSLSWSTVTNVVEIQDANSNTQLNYNLDNFSNLYYGVNDKPFLGIGRGEEPEKPGIITLLKEVEEGRGQWPNSLSYLVYDIHTSNGGIYQNEQSLQNWER